MKGAKEERKKDKLETEAGGENSIQRHSSFGRIAKSGFEKEISITIVPSGISRWMEFSPPTT
jgi:hypothetical protein